MTCAWSNTLSQSNWNIWIVNNRGSILTVRSFHTWVYWGRIWTWFWILVMCKRYCVLYLLSKFFPSRISKKLMICDLFWCRMNLVRRLDWGWWCWDWLDWGWRCSVRTQMTLDKTLLVVSWVNYMIRLYIPILIFSHGCPVKIRLGIVYLVFKKCDIHRGIVLFENRRVTFITLLVWRVSYKNALKRGSV